MPLIAPQLYQSFKHQDAPQTIPVLMKLDPDADLEVALPLLEIYFRSSGGVLQTTVKGLIQGRITPATLEFIETCDFVLFVVRDHR